jgi:hypothetical protein
MVCEGQGTHDWGTHDKGQKRGELTTEGMQGRIQRSKILKGLRRITKNTRETKFQEQDPWFGSEFGTRVLTDLEVVP